MPCAAMKPNPSIVTWAILRRIALHPDIHVIADACVDAEAIGIASFGKGESCGALQFRTKPSGLVVYRQGALSLTPVDDS